MPRLLARCEWVFNASFNYCFILRSRRSEVCPDDLYASPLLRPGASGSSTPHLITVLSSALAGQKSVQTSCMRRQSSIVSASSSTVAGRHNKSSRRGASIIASGPFSVLPIGATFLSSVLSFRPVMQCMRGFQSCRRLRDQPGRNKKWSGEGDCADDTDPHKTYRANLQSL